MSNSLPILRRTVAELLACAVLEVFPRTQLLYGYLTEIGFAYDFVFSQQIDTSAMAFIEEKMRRLIRESIPIELVEMMRENAVEFLLHHKQRMLAETLKNAASNIVQFVKIGEFYGFCSAPVLKTTKEVGVYKLLNITQNTQIFHDQKEKIVTRIEGTAFFNSKALKKFQKVYKASKKWDHRKLGPELDLFCYQEGAAPGCWSWLPKGTILRESLLDWWKKSHFRQKYSLVSTPGIVDKQFFKSNELQAMQNKDLVEFKVEGKECIKLTEVSMMHAQLFKSKARAFFDLPFRYAEISEVFIPLKPHQTYGLFRTRLATIDMGHSFCEENQALEELISCLHFIRGTLNMFEVDYKWYLVAKQPKAAVSRKDWNQGVDLIVKALSDCGFDHDLDPEGILKRGPRVEARLIDALGREWAGPSLEICSLSESMNLRYQGSDGSERQPVMIARTLFGFLERFIALLVEKICWVLPFVAGT